MSLLIKGRKMPKACDCCPCNDDGYRCGVTNELVVGKHDERLPTCPLMEIPDFNNMVICDADSMRCFDEHGNEMRLMKVER